VPNTKGRSKWEQEVRKHAVLMDGTKLRRRRRKWWWWRRRRWGWGNR
jgi:hypothetical protein